MPTHIPCPQSHTRACASPSPSPQVHTLEPKTKSTHEQILKPSSHPISSHQTRRHGSDLFIIDQHASDEKNRYETLMESTTIHEQKLIWFVRARLGMKASVRGLLVTDKCYDGAAAPG